MAIFIDSHCHFDFPDFDDDREDVLRNAWGLGVRRIIAPSVGIQNWTRISQLAKSFDELNFALGIHPLYLHEHLELHLDELDNQLREQRADVSAVGECGLDATADIDFDVQLYFLSEQLRMAKALDLPVILHSRKTHSQLAKRVKESGVKCGVVHAFSGSYEEGVQFVKLGLKLGVGGVITYDRAQKTRKAISRLPLESLLLETDAPDMPLCGRQGRRNSPEMIPQVFNVLCALREEAPERISDTILQNTIDTFDLPGFESKP
ncbi:Mg-dependent DNase [Hahella chejuensis KCTC 2396]|uniref:Mg-dependent DNase n=1 Tax=Hahella chejuensis (strain KCTC 2396) TaxID=349521 RepID=Q2S9X1_HAHCH|nr:TatD family hydrolase [Hahella chejuensis]ABC32553.1 Mg-dependent DNase [Hahella chejuensis KCTC 2396]